MDTQPVVSMGMCGRSLSARIFSVLVFLGFGASHVESILAATINLTTTQDSYIGGTSNTERALPHNDQNLINSDNTRQTILQFDLSQIPAGSTINSAVLQLYLDFATYGTGGNRTMTITGRTHSDANGMITFNEDNAVQSGFEDNVTTFAYPPVTAQMTLGDFPSLAGTGTTTELPLDTYYTSQAADANDLPLLQSIHNAGGSFIISLLGSDPAGSNQRRFIDSEGRMRNDAEDPNNPNDDFITGNPNVPLLVIDYTPVPERASPLLLTIGAMALAALPRRWSRLAIRRI